MATQKMLKRALAILIATAMSASLSGAVAEDLIQIYRDALGSDPILASARATREATQELVPQARAGLLPAVKLVADAGGEEFNGWADNQSTAEVSLPISNFAQTRDGNQPPLLAEHP